VPLAANFGQGVEGSKVGHCAVRLEASRERRGGMGWDDGFSAEQRGKRKGEGSGGPTWVHGREGGGMVRARQTCGEAEEVGGGVWHPVATRA
jgi:hypothetical protein